VIALALLLQLAPPPSDAPYRDRSRPIEVRVQDLLRRMTPVEKFWQLYMTPGDLDDPTNDWSHGVFGMQVTPPPTATAAQQAARIDSIQHYLRTRTRLGIPMIPFDEALHGLMRPDATSFPQAIALAASWDTALVAEVAGAVAVETRRRGIRQVLTPVVNLASDVRWGRTEETYGEDPWLSSRIGVAFARTFESMRVVTTAKHFVANVGDGGRDSYPIELNARELYERHFPPFRALLQEAGTRSVMSAYNSVGGLPATQHPWLLTTVLRREWGFGGVVISDMAATGGPTVLQMTEPNTPLAAKHAWEAGLDVVFQSTWAQHRPYLRAIEEGMVSAPVIDSAVARVLRLKFYLGLFDHDPAIMALGRDHPPEPSTLREIARRAAAGGTVLLKNANQTLPLVGPARSIAVIGVDAEEGRLGGYSGPGTGTVTLLAGIRSAFSMSTVGFAAGPGRLSPEWVTIPATAFGFPAGSGITGEYFDSIAPAGRALLTRQDRQVDFAWTLSTPGEGIANDWFSARWTGALTAPEDLRAIGVEGDDGYRLWVDGRLLIDRWTPGTHRATLAPLRTTAGRRYEIKLEFHSGVPNARIKLIWQVGPQEGWRRKIDEAVALARRSEVAIVVAGIEEGEFRDRSSLALPGQQEELIRAVAATGKPTIVVLVGGSAITMSHWIDEVDAVLMAWYPGQEGGAAIAGILRGTAAPGGRLPITFPVSEGQLPLVYDHRPTGRGDDYLDGTGEPLFPFGFGLSYTIFEYSDLQVTSTGAEGTLPLVVRARVTNRGARAGDEVVQLYVRDEVASLSRPVIQLRSFAKIHLTPGESREVSFRLTTADLAFLGSDGRWIAEPGSFRLMVGASSRDIRLHTRWVLR
jgi:beta-glucosidase